MSRWSKNSIPRTRDTAVWPVRTECSRSPQCSQCGRLPMNAIIGAMLVASPETRARPIRVSANRPSRRSLNTERLASAHQPVGGIRIRATRRATSSAVSGPFASSSGMPSHTAAFSAWSATRRIPTHGRDAVGNGRLVQPVEPARNVDGGDERRRWCLSHVGAAIG